MSRLSPRIAGTRPRHAFTFRWVGPSAVMAGLLVCSLPLSASAATAASDLLPGQFIGSAEAIEALALVGPLSIGLGASSAIGCPCSGTNGAVRKDILSALSIGPAGAVATATTNESTAYGLKTATGAETRQTTTISKPNLLGGLITADAIKATARVDATTTTLTASSGGSMLVNLVIAGQKIDPTIKANTTIPLSGLGAVTVKYVNEVSYGPQAIGIEVEMLRIAVTQTNVLGLPVGTVLIVGEANAGYYRVQPSATIGGYAQGLAVTATAGTDLQAAATAGAFSGIGSCSGTGGSTLTDSVANLSVSGLLSLGSMTTTAFGGPVGSATLAQTSASLADISLLGGLITADGVTAVAQESWNGKVSSASTLGTQFTNLAVLGNAIPVEVAPNTIISLPAVGYIVLNEQPTPSKGTLQVNGLHVVVTVQNDFGMPIGTELFLSHAEATAKKF